MERKISRVFDLKLKDRFIPSKSTIEDAIRAMQEQGSTALLVIDGNKKGIGIISEMDITSVFAEHGEKVRTNSVDDYMSLDIAAIYENQSLNEALKIMSQYNTRYIPVLSEKDTVVGFISIIEVLMEKISDDD